MEYFHSLHRDDIKMMDMLTVAIQRELDDINVLEIMMQYVGSSYEQDIIRQIRLDEQKHYRMFQALYCEISGSDEYNFNPKSSKTIAETKKSTYQQLMFDELEAINFYRKIYFAFSDIKIRDMLYEIITDEQNHVVLLQHLCFV